MSRKGAAILIAGAAMLAGIGGIGLMSVDYVKKNGTGGRTTSFVFGGRAELRNVIEIPLSDVESLSMDYRSKNIRVYPSGEDAVVIKEYLYSDRDEAKASLTFSGEKEALITGGGERPFVLFGFFPGEGERIEVYIPDKSLKGLCVQTGSGNISSQMNAIREQGSLLVSAGSGNVTWSGVQGKEIRIQTGSGNVRVEDLRGNITLHAGSGNITGENLEGTVNAEAGSGNVKLEKFRGGGKAQTKSGNVTVKLESLEEDLALRTGSGNARLELTQGQAFHFQAQTGSGGINTDFEKELSFNKKGNQARGDVGSDPRWTVDVRTGSGTVRVCYRQ